MRFTPTELELLESEYKGVKGVMCLDQGNPGPTVAICAMTHGNEISGFDALTFLLDEMNLREKKIDGKILLITHNLDAYLGYREAIEIRDLGDTEFRFIDKNMNRIYTKECLNNPDWQEFSEIKRANEMIKIVPEIDFIIDLHSTSRPTDPMLLSTHSRADKAISDQLYFYRHVLDFFDKVEGEALLGYTKKHGNRGKNTVGIAVECGSHFQSHSKYCARKTVVRFLQATEVVHLMSIMPPKDFSVSKYRVVKNLRPRYSDFCWAQKWVGFQAVEKGEKIATENGHTIIADDDYVLLMPNAKPKVGIDGVFLAKLVA